MTNTATTRRTLCADVLVNHEGRDMLAFIVAIPGGDPWLYRSAIVDDEDLRGGSPFAMGGNHVGANSPREAFRYHRTNLRMYSCADRAAGNRCTHFDHRSK